MAARGLRGQRTTGLARGRSGPLSHLPCDHPLGGKEGFQGFPREALVGQANANRCRLSELALSAQTVCPSLELLELGNLRSDLADLRLLMLQS